MVTPPVSTGFAQITSCHENHPISTSVFTDASEGRRLHASHHDRQIKLLLFYSFFDVYVLVCAICTTGKSPPNVVVNLDENMFVKGNIFFISTSDLFHCKLQ